MLNNIPHELRTLAQWVRVGEGKLPINPHTGGAADVTNAATWSTFEHACHGGGEVGFVFTAADPYTFIDLDSPLTEEQRARHSRIFQAFDSYTETSRSGQGVHIIVRGRVPHGVRRDKVEVYSEARYAIMTGRVLRPVGITDQQQLLEVLYREMGGGKHATGPVADGDALLEDEELVEVAGRASNGAKFLALCAGDWEAMYPSQSEADYALLSFLCFYSQNSEQVKRLFRMSALGKREKAVKDDKYLNRCIARIRSQETPRVDLSSLRFQASAPAVQDLPSDTAAVDTAGEAIAPDTPIGLPDGLLGEMASFIYQSAYTPLPQAALAGAITLLAGIAGRHYNVSDTGLNQYVVLLAPTGTGKESAATGVDKLVSAVRMTTPPINDFVGPAKFSSGQGLLRVLSERPMPSMFSIIGEAGLLFRTLYDKRASAADTALLQVLLDLYMKSGQGRVMRSSAYSDVAKNTKDVTSPAVSVLCESVPSTFYDSLTEESLSGGLLPRMLVLEYVGEGAAPNRAALRVPPASLVQRLGDLVVQVHRMASNNSVAPVQFDSQSAAYCEAYEMHCKEQQRGASEAVRQLWSRAHLKMLRLAALVAVGVNHQQPVIRLRDAEWAVDMVSRGTQRLMDKVATGELGGDEAQQVDVVVAAMVRWAEMRPAQRLNRNAPRWCYNDPAMVPMSYIIRECQLRAAFKTAQGGAARAIEACLLRMVRGGQLHEIPPGQRNELGFRGVVYALPGG